MGIELVEAGPIWGVTTNDGGDGDSGANDLQNFPVLTSATSGTTTIEGTFNSAPNTEFRLEFFSNSACDPSSHGEGETFIGYTTVVTDGSGDTDLMRIIRHPKVDFCEPSDFLSTEVVMPQLTRNVVDLAVAEDVQNVEWESGDGFSLFFKVYLAQAPRLKQDYAGNLGVAHATSA